MALSKIYVIDLISLILLCCDINLIVETPSEADKGISQEKKIPEESLDQSCLNLSTVKLSSSQYSGDQPASLEHLSGQLVQQSVDQSASEEQLLGQSSPVQQTIQLSAPLKSEMGLTKAQGKWL